MTKNPFIKKKTQSDATTIQITSMADIFTIILVFLLKSYATSSIQISPTPGMNLALARANDPQIEALKIEISEKGVQVEDTPVATLDNFNFDPKDLQPNGASTLLGASLDVQKKRQLLISKSNSDVKADSKVLIVADRRTPYQTIKSVLASASTHGFTDFKLVVAKKE